MNAVTGLPRVLLQIEGLAILVISAGYYFYSDFSWILYAVLFLAPDISMMGYLANKSIGAICYNFAHTYSVPLLIFGLCAIMDYQIGLAISLIWIAHIGFDRMVGYGLKYGHAFKATHLSSSE